MFENNTELLLYLRYSISLFMRLIITFLFLYFSVFAYSQNTDNLFDPAFADSLGADDYGMKSYVFVVLKTGPKTVTDRDSVNVLMRGHLDNISRLAEAGKIILAGPYGENDLNFRGLFIFNETDIDEVGRLLQSDPAIAAGVFATEIIPWYGSAALPTYLPNHSKVQKLSP